MTELVELFQFLDSPNPAARQIALTNLLGHTAKNDPERHMFIPSVTGGIGGGGLLPQKRNAASEDDERKIKALRDLCGLCRDQPVIAHDAISALINLSDTIAAAKYLVEQDFLVWLISYTANTTSPLSSLTAMLLSNLTSHPNLVAHIASLKIPVIPLPLSKTYPPYFLPASLSATSTIHPDFRDPTIGSANKEAGQEEEREVEGLRALVQAFEDGASDGVKDSKGKRKGECHFLASVFANISMAPALRSLLLAPRPPFPQPSSTEASSDDEPLLSKIVVYTEHPDTIRRGGALGCIKNCAMDRGSMPWLLASENDRVKLPSDPTRTVKGVDVLPFVMSPLMGPEEYDMDEMDKLPATLQFLGTEKKREQDTVLRMMCVEILLLLSTTYTGRQSMRDRGTYYVVREAHKVETDQQIKEAIERLVSLIEGEESQETSEQHIQELLKAEKAEKAAANDETDVVEV